MLGHEITGEVIEKGVDVEFIDVGDIVSVPFNVACGRCRTCRAGDTGVCLTVNPGLPGGAYGYVDMGGWIGGQARYVMTPYADFNLLKFPDRDQALAKIRDLTMLTDILPTGFHAAVRAQVGVGSTVYVAGCGPVGLAAAADAKMSFDDNALFRRHSVADMHDPSQQDPREAQAAEHNLNYIGLDGEIGCIVNGAGLAMATMDMIKHAGGSPANFLDVGGGASPERIATALKLVLSDAKVKAVLVNIFAGINRCDWVAKGVVQACQTVDVKVPLVVRLAGTNVEEGRKILADSGVEMITAETLAEAANKAVAACNAATQEPARARA